MPPIDVSSFSKLHFCGWRYSCYVIESSYHSRCCKNSATLHYIYDQKTCISLVAYGTYEICFMPTSPKIFETHLAWLESHQSFCYSEKFRFSAEFIEMRRQALDLFINRVASHPELKQSEDLRIFLQEYEETMERARTQETGIFKKKPADFMQLFKDVQSKVTDVVLGKEKPIEESNPEYEKLKHYIFELEDHLAEAQKQAFRLVKRHKELGQSLSDFGKANKLLGACEGDSLGKAFSELGSKSEFLSLKLQKEAHNLLMNFEEPLKDYVRAVQSIKATMVDRANAFRQQNDLAETTKLKEINLDKLMLMRSEKAREAEIEYKELKAESEDATRRYETIVKLMSEEIVLFQEQKTAEMGLAFHEFAKGQERLAKESAGAWRSLVPKLEKCSSS